MAETERNKIKLNRIRNAWVNYENRFSQPILCFLNILPISTNIKKTMGSGISKQAKGFENSKHKIFIIKSFDTIYI